MKTAQYWIDELDLQPHPEGGYYKEIYRNNVKVKAKEFSFEKNAATSIYYLLEKEDKSHFHRLVSDEIWYFHMGDPLTVCMFTPEGEYEEVTLGPAIEKNEFLQVIIPKKTIFGAYLQKPDSFVLMGCMVNPGFDFTDFELMKKDDLLEMFPDKRKIIEYLTV